ncbi:MAG TPA: hypothetical protein VFU89_02360, partial [Rhabdochlamydiaceae bacterium]|nr:hypothetical protein [Rhabdochlamydiaceae bacterium]
FLPAITLCADDPSLEQELQVAEELPVDTHLTLPASIEGHEITIPDTPSIVPISPGEKLPPVMIADQPSTNLDSSDNPSPPTQPPIPPENFSEWCLSPYHAFHASIRHNEANGIGYKHGYTTLEIFGIYDRIGSGFMPFFDLKGHLFNDGKWAGNLGIGERTLLTSINHTFGSYLYYDVRRVGHGLTVNQVSPGIELVGERMEYRINGYFPVGKNKGRRYGYAFDEFKGNSIILRAKQQQAMMGGDAEVGVHIPQNTTYDVYAAAGPYYFHSSNASAWGGKARLLGRYKEYVTLEVAYSYDRLFRNVFQGSVALTLPFGGKLRRCGKCCPQDDNLLLSRSAFAPSRFEIPVVKRVHRKEKAINPATAQPWIVWFVDNTSHSLGTYESPFPTLVAAQTASGPNDIIYVFPGDGKTTGMDAGITLKDGQQLFGSGIAQSIPTTKGQLTIPAHSSGQPQITNLGGSVVTLANGNQVSGLGLQISLSGSAGINGTSAIQDALIQNNTIVGSVPHTGIHIDGFGKLFILNNQVTGPISSNDGISLKGLNGTSSVIAISYNQVSGYQNGVSLGPDSNPSTADTNAIVQGNNITHFNRAGIFYFSGFSNSTVQILDNNVLNDVGVAGGGSGAGSIAAISVSVNNPPSDGTVIIGNNQIITTTSSLTTCGIKAAINVGTGDRLFANITQNSVVTGPGAGSVGISLYSDNNDSICASLTGNQVTPTAVSGTNDFTMVTNGSGTINIQNIADNIGSNVSATGNVNFVSSCSP